MELTCISNHGFANNLTIKKKYELIEETIHGYIIEDDKGIVWEYAKSRFKEYFLDQ